MARGIARPGLLAHVVRRTTSSTSNGFGDSIKSDCIRRPHDSTLTSDSAATLSSTCFKISHFASPATSFGGACQATRRHGVYRHLSDEFKRAIVAQSLLPNAFVSRIAASTMSMPIRYSLGANCLVTVNWRVAAVGTHEAQPIEASCLNVRPPDIAFCDDQFLNSISKCAQSRRSSNRRLRQK